jgi:hypothetical protein
MTSVFVTHDQTEAMTLADRIVCLEAGRVAQVGLPDELCNRPAPLFVAGFIGAPPINLLAATAEGRHLRRDDGQGLTLPDDAPALPGPRRVMLGLRPEDLSDAGRQGTMAQAQGLVMDDMVSETLGSDTFLIGEVAGSRVTARCAAGTRPAPGSKAALAGKDAIRDLTPEGLGLVVEAFQLGGASYHGAGWCPRHIEGVEHHVFYALEARRGVTFLHGQAVCPSPVAGAMLHGRRGEELRAVVGHIGVDIRPEAMGITCDDVDASLRGLSGLVRAAGLRHGIAHDFAVDDGLLRRLRQMVNGHG